MPWSAMQIFVASFGASRHQMLVLVLVLASTSLSDYQIGVDVSLSNSSNVSHS